MLLFTAATIWRTHEADRLREQDALQAIATSKAERIDLAFESLRASLLTLADSGSVRNGDWHDAQREIQTLNARTGVTVHLFGPDGRSLDPQDDAVAGSAVTLAIQKALRTHAAVLTNLLSTTGGEPSVALAVPGFKSDDPNPSFAIVARPGRTWLWQLTRPSDQAPAGLIITVFDQNGIVISRSIEPERFVGHPAHSALRQVMRHQPDGLLTVPTLDGVPGIAAFRQSEATGWTAAAIMPQRAFSMVLERDLAATIALGAAMLLGGLYAASRIAARLVRAIRSLGRHDGALPQPSGVRELDELAAHLHTIALARDATEASLLATDARLRDLIATLDLATIMTREMDGTIRFWSQGCERMYGWTAEEALGRLSHVLLRTQFPRSLAEIEATLREDGEWTGDLVHRRKDGERIVVAVHKVLRKKTDGSPDLVLEGLVDVTALRDAQDRLRAVNQDLEQRVQSEIAAREAAQQRAAHNDRIQALGQLAGGIAHDFNNILQAIAGAAALIARHPRDAEMVGRFIGIISDAATRGASITRRILLLARRGDLKPEPIAVGTLLTDVRDVLAFTLGAAIKIELDVAPALPPLAADRAQLETALVNLATNARDAMPNGGLLRMTAAEDTIAVHLGGQMADLAQGAYIRLSVSDTGIGMNAATLARIGEPFFTTKGVGKGTGLGLSMVKGFAEQSGGGFGIESEPGRGTVATIWLPVSNAPMVRTYNGGPAVRGIARILLVDDDPLVRDSVTEQLEDLGHKVLSASGGTDALAILRARQAVDLMITDLAMPGMNGLALIREAREVLPQLPAILLTGYPSRAVAMSRDSEVKPDYTLIRKPASTAVLKARIGELLH
ncbi:MAG TPA: ATP-binding protein [Rhodopila sp.]|nr:ATP-binding protein [Rhodopila sp.]